MPFNIAEEDEFDLDYLSEKIDIPEYNIYITDKNKAIELIATVIKNKSNPSIYFKKKIEGRINDLFSLFSKVSIENEIEFYEKFMDLCSRLSEYQKIKKIQDKVVISFGGAVSAGKSKFINTISGIGEKLPVDQKTTTAIPTYIIKSSQDLIYANSVYGYSSEISPEVLNAMAHEFDNTYGIGFATFINSIIIESKEYALPEEIALLDTPGYTDYDGKKSDAKMVMSDRQKAYEQLSISDYLIWLIDIDTGTITNDDIEFIEALKIKTPILIVFTKADLKSDKAIEQIIEVAKEIISKTTIRCFGITAYSANLKKEYKTNMINNFLNHTVLGDVRNNDIISEFRNVEKDMRDAIIQAMNQSKSTAKELFSYISNSDRIMEVRSLAILWGKANQDGYELDKLLKRYNDIMHDINKEIRKYFEEG